MGQQQLLLLVLSTVIVGLATVAGIQAFSENQAQATEDALVQRAINIGNDILAAHNEPSQFGGVNLDASSTPAPKVVGKAAGYTDDDDGTSGFQISADGAGDNAACSIGTSTGQATVNCGSNGATGGNQTVTVTVDPDGDPKVSTSGV